VLAGSLSRLGAMQDGTLRNFFPQAQGAFTAGLGQQLGGRGPYIGAPAMTSAAPAQQQQQHFAAAAGLQGAGLQQLRFVQQLPNAGQMGGHPLDGLNPQLTAQSRLLAGMRAGAVGNPAAAAAAAAAAGQNPQLLQQLQQQQQRQQQAQAQQFAAAQQFGAVNLGGNTLGGLAMAAGQHPLGGRVGQPDILNLLQQGNLKQAGGLGAVNLNAAQQAAQAQGQAAAAAAMLANRGLGGMGVGFSGGAGGAGGPVAAGLVGQLQQAAAAAAASAGIAGGGGGESDAGPSFAADEFPALGAAAGPRPSGGAPGGGGAAGAPGGAGAPGAKVGDASYASLALRRQAAGAGGVGPVGGGAAGGGAGAQAIDFSIQNESDFPALGGGGDGTKRFGGAGSEGAGTPVGGGKDGGKDGPGGGGGGGGPGGGGGGPLGTPSSAAAAAAAGDRYGLLGLLQVIRMTDQDLTMLALGTDLTSLGLNLNSPEPLYKSMVSPLSDNPIRREPEFEVRRARGTRPAVQMKQRYPPRAAEHPRPGPPLPCAP
jgi:CCR4-NOT transcription complex subunit 2